MCLQVCMSICVCVCMSVYLSLAASVSKHMFPGVSGTYEPVSAHMLISLHVLKLPAMSGQPSKLVASFETSIRQPPRPQRQCSMLASTGSVNFFVPAMRKSLSEHMAAIFFRIRL